MRTIERYDHPELGEIELVRSMRARRIIISVRPEGMIRLTIPKRVSLKDGLIFLNAKKEWVIRTLAKQKSRPRTVITEDFFTREHTLRITPGTKEDITVSVRGGVILVTHPQNMSTENPEVQHALKRGIEEAWRKEAKEILPGRLSRLAAQHGFRHGKVSVRNTVSKWGSCSVRNDISLSLHLMRLPDHLIDYIILHELCHTVHKNHGPAFHSLLDSVTGGRHKELRMEIRAYGTRW